MLHDFVAARHGIASRRQLLELGLSSSAIGRLLDHGTLTSIHQGVYRHGAVPPTWEADVLAATLASGGIASHRSAARLHGIEGFGRWTPEVTIDRAARRRLTDAIVHSSTQIDRADAVVKASIMCTGVDRTILDLGAVMRLPTLELAAEAALRQRLTTWTRLHGVLAAHSRRGRDGCGVLRALLEERHGSPVVPLSKWSREVARELAARGYSQVELEYRIVDPLGTLVLQVDLAFPDAKVAIELDSIAHHLDRKSFERDKRTRNQLRALGWVVLEVTWREWEHRPALVVQTIRRTLESRLPTRSVDDSSR